jgi:catechol 2,3-dioxygenase-like lactoylglutathione lyase family enzyme
MSLRHLALLTRDLAGTERFYTEILGLQRAFDHEGMLFLRTPGRDDLLNFVATRRPFDPAGGGLDHFGLHLTAARWRTVRERLRRAGVKINGRRGRSAVYIEDPNGYTVELYID